MITSQDRSMWFGASDTAHIMGSWSTYTFMRWWLEKLGVVSNTYTSPAMLAGTHYEHKILDALGIEKRDRQIRFQKLRLRVNLDGETFCMVHEVKTHKADTFKVTKAYWQQCQVQMFAAGVWCEIIAYRLLPDDYINFYNIIDMHRITRHPIAYSPLWVQAEYLPRLIYLADCLTKRKTPFMSEFKGNLKGAA